jgi:hypothetical protein
MKYLLLSLFMIISLETMFTGCIKDDCDGCIKDTTFNPMDTTNKDTVLTGKDFAGPLRIAVRIGTVAGPFAGGAQVKLAYTFDSVNMEKYFITLVTNDSGFVTFKDLPVDAVTKTRFYYADAYFIEGGEELNSTNGNGSNGPLAIEVRKNIASYKQLVVTYK